MALKSKAGVLIAGTAVVASLLTGCGEETAVEEVQEAGPTAEAAILGETVTIQSEVQDVAGPNAFTVGDGLEEGTLVTGKGISEGLEEGNKVQVTGTVRSFIKAETSISTTMKIPSSSNTNRTSPSSPTRSRNFPNKQISGTACHPCHRRAARGSSLLWLPSMTDQAAAGANTGSPTALHPILIATAQLLENPCSTVRANSSERTSIWTTQEALWRQCWRRVSPRCF
jgi:hypothetical protein